jgi:branched-chain amino acid transport system substrate-binding protein
MKSSNVIACLLIISALALVTTFNGENALGQPKKEPIKIGMLAEKTGSMAAYGYSHERVVNAAISRINQTNGIGGRPIKLYIEDTETNAQVGALKFRKLVETYGVDFVVNSNFAAVGIACAPIAKELKTLYFPCLSVPEISGEKGNRYVFPFGTSITQECKGGAEFAAQNLGKKWVTIVMNYSWGHTNEAEFTKYITARGGTVLKSIRVPLGTGDWLPYLKGNIPAEAEAVFFANFGTDFINFNRDLHAVRPGIKRLGAAYAIAAQDPKKLGIEGEGLYCLTSYPTCLDGLNTSYNKTYRELIGVDANGKENGTGTYFVLAYNWGAWESLFALKQGVEKSGWKGKEDTPRLIKTLEGMEFKQGVEFPQGDMFIRAEDHRNITGLYIEQIQKGQIKVVTRIPAKDAVFSPTVNRTQEPL